MNSSSKIEKASFHLFPAWNFILFSKATQILHDSWFFSKFDCLNHTFPLRKIFLIVMDYHLYETPQFTREQTKSFSVFLILCCNLSSVLLLIFSKRRFWTRKMIFQSSIPHPLFRASWHKIDTWVDLITLQRCFEFKISGIGR